MKRGFVGLLLILSPFVLPWWISFLLCISLIFFFDNLYEVIAVGVIIDYLYGSHFDIYGFTLIFTVILTICFYLISKFKSQIFI